MFHQYSRQQSIDTIEQATYSRLKYWDRMHGILLKAENSKDG